MPAGSDLGSILSSSSLMGAMGESTTPSRRSVPPNSSGGRRMYSNGQSHNAQWNINTQPSMGIPNMNLSTYPPVSGHENLSFTQMSSSFPLSPHSPNYQDHHYSQGHSSTQLSGNNGMSYQGVSPYLPPSTPSNDQGDDEVNRLRRRVRELELECTRNRSIIASLRPSPSPSFQESWRSRTESRKRIFCSLNRAGNALCAWHDSRRERRVYAPRQAPAGFLNCGCTFEEALFEESLSRNNVGSYHPGEAVRMDPALRNPLLKLLEKRYGYKDGDFERDPNTERWAEGESPAIWEQKAQSGQTSRRRADSDRH
ncbi:hypothetical protein BYT27DRAFT_6696103 [Phlegmacium glaucopus]|nr:hypothetical protein BYT27DRAFT_6696103 [Phlegmacium glaucopus]